MKKFLLAILMVLVFATNSYTATFNAIAAGAWSDVDTWRTVSAWAASNNYAATNFVKPLAAENGYVYEVTTDNGSSGEAEPTWSTTIGGTTADGDLIWTTRAGSPQGGDTVDLSSGGTARVVTMDITTIPVSGNLVQIMTTTAGGSLTLDLDAVGNSTINVETITGKTSAAVTLVVTGGNAEGTLALSNGGGTCQITGGTTGGAVYFNSVGTATVTCNITGGTGTANAFDNHTTGTVNVTGTLTGGTGGTGAVAFANTATGVVTITGNIVGGSGAATANAYGFNNTTNGAVTVNGDITGGSSTGAYSSPGFLNQSNAAVTVNCVTAITGGSAYGSQGFSNSKNGTVTLTGCNLINGTGGTAFGGHVPVWSPGNTNYLRWYDTGAGAAKNFYVDTDPGIANVKKDTTYYFQSGTVKTGTLESGSGGGVWGF